MTEINREKVLVLSTCASLDEAKALARALVERRLAACVQIAPLLASVYWWQGKVEESAEFLLIIKTSRAQSTELIAALAALHSYEVPEAIVLPITGGWPPYLDWLDKELTPSPSI